MNDLVSDFLTRFRNAYMAGKLSVKVKKSKLVENVAKIFKEKKLITSIKEDGYYLEIELATDLNLTKIKRLSKPGIRRYVKYTEIPRPNSGFSLIILSTPKGVLTAAQARKQKVGGELVCEVW